MSRLRRKPYHHGDLHRELVDAGLAVLRETGRADFTLRSLARRIGVSHAAPYAHFADRRAVLAEIARVGFDLLTAAMSGPRRDLVSIGVAYVLFGYRNPAHYRLMFGAPELADYREFPALDAAATSCYAVLTEAIAAIGGSEADTLAAWSTVHGLTSLIIDDRPHLRPLSEERVHAMAQATCTTLLTGVAGRPSAP
jgi:AcrR family transcriptional regulator